MARPGPASGRSAPFGRPRVPACLRALLALAVLVVPVTGCRALPPRLTETPRRVVAWLIGGAPGLASLQANIDAIDVVSPAYYRVVFPPGGTALEDWDAGNPVDRARVRAVAAAAKVPVVPLVACVDACGTRLSAVLADPAAREAHIRVLLERATADAVDGLFIDYEGITCSAADFRVFAERLRAELGARRLTLGLAVTEPCGWEPSCHRPGYPFDLRALAQLSDYLAVMSYDYTIDGSTAVAPRAWVRLGLRRVARDVGAGRAVVFAGVPFYGRISAGVLPDTAVLWGELNARRLQGQPVEVRGSAFDAEKLAQVAQVSVGAARRPAVVHYEDHESLAARLGCFEDEGVAGVALWRLGDEDPCNWDVLRAWKRREPARCSPRPAPPPSASTASVVAPPLVGPVPPAERRVLAWMLGGEDGLASLQRARDALDVVSPAFWRLVPPASAAAPWTLGEWDAGNPVARERTLALARAARIAVWPLVACHGACAARLSVTLRDEAARHALVAGLAQGARAAGVDGLFLDVQGVTTPAPVFSGFVAEVAAALRREKRQLGVAVPEPCGFAPECRREPYPYELGALAQTVDALAVLHYDYAVDGREAGAPRDWFVRGMTRVRAETGAARSHVYVGLPTYGRISAGLAGDTAVLWSELRAGRVQGRAAALGPHRFDAAKLSQVAPLRVGKKKGTAYFENAQTTAQRLGVLDAEGFGRVALWRLGGEDPCTWDVLRAWKRGEPTAEVVCETR